MTEESYKQLSRRKFIKQSSILTLAGISHSLTINANANNTGNSNIKLTSPNNYPFELPKINYSYNALEPHIDKATMEIHHTKHHQAYIDKLNKALSYISNTNTSLTDILKNCSQYATTIRNNAGGHYNHSLFWKLLKPNGGGLPDGMLANTITQDFGSFEKFKNKFTDVAKSHFGSGWTWLVLNNNNKLEIGTTANQDNPLMDNSALKGTPILALDIWEHAYYLNYQNKRADYINAWWNVINWEQANINLKG